MKSQETGGKENGNEPGKEGNLVLIFLNCLDRRTWALQHLISVSTGNFWQDAKGIVLGGAMRRGIIFGS